MSARSTESLLRELAQSLAPVRVLPSLRTVAATVLGGFAVAIALNGLLGLPMPDFGRAVWRDPVFLALLCGLAVVAVGGTTAALTGAVPGREPEGRVAGGVALAGLIVAIGAGTVATLAFGRTDVLLPIRSSLMCTLRGAALGLPPMLVVSFFLGRALYRRPAAGAAAAILGAAGLGASFVHASCTSGDALHMLMGHAGAPITVALVLLVPCALLIRLASKRLAPPG